LPRNIQSPLFRDNEVEKKLNITPEQLGRLGETDVQLRQGLKGALRDTGRLSSAAAAVRSDQLLLKYNSDLMHATMGVLEPRQMERYRQLSRASEGLYTFTDPDVIEGLRLTEKQRERIRAIREEINEKINDLTKKEDADVPAALEKAADLRREGMRQVGTVLESKQKQAFAKMTGYHFATESKSGETSGAAGSATPDRR